MMDYTSQHTPEHGLVQRLVRSSTQLQREEGFLTIEEQDLARSLGINWFQATSFKQAERSLDEFLKDNKSEQSKEIALVRGLKALLSELIPTLFALRLSGDDSEEYMPDEGSLLMRLRHHFMLEIIYQEHFAQPIPASRSTQSPFALQSPHFGRAVRPPQSSLGIDIWLAHMDSAIRFVYDELGLSKSYVDKVLAGDINSLLPDPAISQSEKALLMKFMTAVEETRRELKDDYEKKSEQVRPSQMAALIPTMLGISHLIRSYIQRAYLVEEEQAVISKVGLYGQHAPSGQCPPAEPDEKPKEDIAQVLQNFINNSGGS